MGVERPFQPERKQAAPADAVRELLQIVRRLFYRGVPDKGYFQDVSLLKRNVILWPAWWFDDKGLSLPAERYTDIMRNLFAEIASKGQRPKYVPGYLAKCVQDHFRIQGERYLTEAKAMSSRVDAIIARLGSNQAQAARAKLAEVRQLAALRQATKPGGPRTKSAQIPQSQMSLF